MVNHYFWVFPEEICIWIGGLTKAHGSPQCGWASPNTLRAYKELKCRGRLNLSAWLQSCDIIFSCPQPSWFSGLQTWAGLSIIISSMTLRLLNSITGFPESPACRRSFMVFVSLYNCVSQFLIIYLSICLPTYLPPSLPPSGSVSVENQWDGYNFCLAHLEGKCLLWTITHAPFCRNMAKDVTQLLPCKWV